MSLSRVSLGRISLVLRHVQQGVSPGGSAGAMIEGGTYTCGLLGTALPQYVTLGENMKPYEGKHESPERESMNCIYDSTTGVVLTMAQPVVLGRNAIYGKT